MKWYKKQLDEKLKNSRDKKTETDKKTSKLPFDPTKIKANKHTFHNPVAAKNINRPKTDKP